MPGTPVHSLKDNRAVSRTQRASLISLVPEATQFLLPGYLLLSGAFPRFASLKSPFFMQIPPSALRESHEVDGRLSQ